MTSGPAATPKFWLIDTSTQTKCEVLHTSTVGREKCDLIFARHTSLSRCHFRIIIDDEGAWLEDVGSSNGTQLNGVEIEARVPHPLKSGDRITAGRAEFVFEEGIRDKVSEVSSVVIESPSGMHRPLKEKVVESSSHHDEEIQVMLVKPFKSRRRHDPSHEKEETLARKKGSSGGGLHPQWVTALFAISLGGFFLSGWFEIQSTVHQEPHSSSELLARYAGSVGLTYLSMMIFQALFVVLFAKRWTTALVLVVFSAVAGSFTSIEFEKRFQYRAARIENKTHLMNAKLQRELKEQGQNRVPAKARPK